MTRLGLFVLTPVFALLSVIALLLYLIFIVFNQQRARRMAVSWDQLANTIANGHEDETISSRAGKSARLGKTWGCVLCKVLDWIDKDHCEKSIEADRGR